MACTYPYATSRQALFEPAAEPPFFEKWTAADVANHDLLSAELSRLAYARRDIVMDALASVGYTLREWIGSESGRDRLRTRGTDGFVATSQDDATTVAVFRGTEANKPEDVLADLVVIPTRWADHSQVHKGFADAYAAEHDQIRVAIARHSRGHLIVTGHSLGAALATLVAADHRDRNPTLITFGSPRVGDDAFGALLGGIESRRFVNCCDIVARIPPDRFAVGSIRALLRDLTGASPLSFVTVLADPLSDLFTSLTGDVQFSHVGHMRYADQGGRLQASIEQDAIDEDQQHARESYPAKRRPDPGALFSRLAEAAASRMNGGAIREALLRSARELLSGDDVPLRDLADHAPINYVSIFTGRH